MWIKMNSFYGDYLSADDRERRLLMERVRAFWQKLPPEDRREIFDDAFDKLSVKDQANILAQAARIYPEIKSMGERLAMELVACLGMYMVLKEYGHDALRKTDRPAH